MNLKWFGTATILMSEEDTSILFDPFISMNEETGAYAHEDAAGVKNIFITHGHFDHLVDVPQLVRGAGKTVHCCPTAAETLQREEVSPEQINSLAPGDRIEIGPFNIRVLKGEHINFDLKLIATTLFNRRLIRNRENAQTIARLNRNFPQGQVLVFEIEAKGKKILHMGSLNLDEEETYPEGVDVLTIPFQGRSDLNEYSLQFMEKLQPKALYLHHFDDTFPPISRSVDLEEFRKIMEKRFPHIKVIVPAYRESISI